MARRPHQQGSSPIQVDHRRIHEPARLGVEHKARGTAEQRVGASVDVSAGCRDLGSRRPAGTHSRARRRAGPGSSARRGIPLQRLHGTAQLFQRLLLQRRHTLQLLLVLLAPPVREQHLALEEVGLGLLGVLFRGIALPLGGVDVLAGLAVLLVTHDLLHLEGPHIAGLPLLLLLRHLRRLCRLRLRRLLRPFPRRSKRARAALVEARDAASSSGAGSERSPLRGAVHGRGRLVRCPPSA
mmetsp:Transcript_14045/g.41493  ORF Transcript_14045/g.41493 Transcript_14045/m.41493 type:complete len:240 (-) Transcript_14045:24-743(-)